MVLSKIKRERAATAENRFFSIRESNPRAVYQHIVCDNESRPKTIAKFKDKEHADGFLGWLRARYVNKDV